MFAGSSFSWLCRVVDKQQTTNMARTRIKSKRPSLPTRSLDSQSRKRLMNMFSGFICCFFCLLERVMGFLMAPPWQGSQTAAQHQHECGATAYPKGNGGRKHTQMCCCCSTSGNNFQMFSTGAPSEMKTDLVDACVGQWCKLYQVGMLTSETSKAAL